MASKSPHEPPMTLPELFPGEVSTRFRGWPMSRLNRAGSLWTLYGVSPSGERRTIQAAKLAMIAKAAHDWPRATLEGVRVAMGWAD